VSGTSLVVATCVGLAMGVAESGLPKPDSDQGAHALIVLSALANSSRKRMGMLIAFDDFLRKKVQREMFHCLNSIFSCRRLG